MKKSIIVAIVAMFSAVAFAAETNTTPDQAEAKYTAAIEGRTVAILKILDLSDTNRAAKVHDTIIAQYRALNAWHDENDAKLKAAKADTNAVAQIHVSLNALHDNFLSKLAENISAEQIEQVKDKMTYGKVQFTYAGYMSAYLDLAEVHKQKILELLKEAREIAMDGGNSEEKTAVFTKYKGKINNYLSKQGIHPEKQKAQTTPAATNSTPSQ